MTLTPTQANLVIQQLIAENRISLNEIRHILETQAEIQRIEARLEALRGKKPARRVITSRRRISHNGRRRRISRNGRASYKIQGQYIGYLRQIPKSQRAKFQRIAKGEGRERAIQLMREELGK